MTATIQGSVAGVLSGMAPAARLAIYKVLYSNAAQTQSVGSAQDIVAAIDHAVADGVDVINYSIGDNNDGFGADRARVPQRRLGGRVRRRVRRQQRPGRRARSTTACRG